MATVQNILDKKGTDVISAPRADTVLDAAKKMNENRIGALVVTDGETVVGIFTERDILVRVVAGGRDPSMPLG